MTVPADTHETYQTIGLREDLSDVISRISPDETPFQSNVRSVSASAVKTEWQIQDLDTATPDNAVAEGDDATNTAVVPTGRPGNFLQLMDKVVQVSTTNRAVDAAGRADEMAYQLVLKGIELKNDAEMSLTHNIASSAGVSGTARRMGGFEAWLETNTDRSPGTGTPGADGGYNAGTGVVDAATDSDLARAFTEDQVKAVQLSCFQNGGKPTVMMVGPFNKQAFSAFTGIAETRRPQSADAMTTIIGAADVYVGDFGNLAVTPSNFSRDQSALMIDPTLAGVGILQAMSQDPLAKTGHSDRRMISQEITLVVDNEAGHGIIADLTTSAP